MKLETWLVVLGLAGAALAPACGAEKEEPAVRVVIPAGKETSTARIAIARLQDYGAFRAEIGDSLFLSAAPGNYALTILLGSAKDSSQLQGQWAAYPGARADSYLIKTLSAQPLTIVASGLDQRGTLYAAYHLADLLKAKGELSALDIFRQPRIAERYVSFGATTHGRKIYSPEQHWKTLKELPGFGYNGIVIYPGGGTPIGRHSSPLLETTEGKLRLDPENTRRWREWFRELKQYQLGLMMTIPPVIPPGYSNGEIENYYAGGPEPKGYLPALQSHFRQYLELLTQGYPELDKFMFNSTEGATSGRNVRFFGAPDPRRFSNAAYLRNNEQVMRAYFDVLSEFFESDLSRVYFWTHSFGLTSQGIAKMREVLFQYPQVTIIEDDYWNNNLWPFDLPAMAFLPPDLRAKVSTNNPFALFQIATDGEYYGGGSVPNAWPGSHIRSAREAVKRNARMVIQRLDLHDRTLYGTAFGTMKIVPYAASRHLWEPTPTEADIWQEWASARFGKEAAEPVIRALQESRSVIVDGLSCNGVDLLAVGSEFGPRHWKKDDRGLTRFYLFGKPGQRLVKKQPGDVIYSGEYTAWEMDTHSISIREFRKNQEEARLALKRGLEQVEKAGPHLETSDYEMLRGIFENGEKVLKAVRLLGETAYATNLLLDNFDHVDNPRGVFERAMAEMDAFLKEGALAPSMARNIRTILKGYQACASRSK